MNGCYKFRKLFTDALYNELDPAAREWFEEHRNSCSLCAEEFKKATAALAAMDERTLREPDESYWESYWDKLESRLPEAHDAPSIWGSSIQRLRHAISFNPRPLINVAAGIALIAVGVLAGRISMLSDPVLVQESAADYFQQEILADRIDNYIDRTKIILSSISNIDLATDDLFILDLPGQRRVSRDLIEEAKYIREELAAKDKDNLLDLVLDLQMALLWIGNIDQENPMNGLLLVRSGIEQNDLLMKITFNELERMSQRGAFSINQ
ncbi:hypothetical protein ACFL67_00055 [candidate division KSB1 bacterium]